MINGRTKYLQGYSEGWKVGYEAAVGKFDVPCSGCGKPLVIDMKNPEHRAVLMKFFEPWRHGSEECHY